MGERLLIKKEKKQYVEDIGKTVVLSKAKTYLVKDTSKDFHTEYGHIKKADFSKSFAKTSSGAEFFILTPCFIDIYKRLPRLPQTISLKEIGVIITKCGITKESVVADAGTGSAGLAGFLGKVCKKVYSFDINQDHLELAKQNLKELKITNVVLKRHDVYNDFPVKDIDVVCLDVPEPWKAVKSASEAVKTGGFIVSFSPCITQSMKFVEEVNRHEGLLHLETIETISRNWKIEGQAVRPKSELSHTAFLSFVRKLRQG